MSERVKQTGQAHRILLRVAYDGTVYHGWQIQPGEVTVEGVLNRELCRLTGEEIQVIGASRTDAGVHALGNVAVFDTASGIPAEKFSYALNQRLPGDIVVQDSCEVPGDFHPRRCSCRKTYEYRILHRRFPLPEYRNTAYFVYGSLDIGSMEKACRAFIGEHDFAAFCAAGAQVKSTVRTIYALEVAVRPLGMVLPLEGAVIPASEMPPAVPSARASEICRHGGSDSAGNKYQEQLITIRVQGNGFLYNMVRIIAGTLLEVGKGRIGAEEVAGMIASCDRGKAGPTAPARGLTLVGIEYGVS